MTAVADDRRKGRVFLVGAGPGDPELLTLHAFHILKMADVILHDDLVTPEILALVRTRRIENVGKRCGVKHVSQTAINARMIQLAGEGFMVGRLKCGDPLVFGRAGEEIEALRNAGIEFKIIPGVTATSSAAACAGISLTDRRCASQAIFVSAHCSVGRTVTDGGWGKGQRATTIVIHMPGNDLVNVQQRLLDSCRNPETPCVIVSSAGRPEQHVLKTTIEGLAAVPRLASPKILIVGDVAAGAIGGVS